MDAPRRILVSELLELTRAEAGLPNEHREPVALDALLAGICQGLGADPRYAQVRFEVAGPDDGSPLEVEGVPLRLESLFRNLVDNAASFAAPEGWVRVGLSRVEDRISVTVSDSGPGIPEEALPRVFDRFFTHRRDRRGSGLGLALARAVVEAHGGRIHAASPPGRGAVFTVELPDGGRTLGAVAPVSSRAAPSAPGR